MKSLRVEACRRVMEGFPVQLLSMGEASPGAVFSVNHTSWLIPPPKHLRKSSSEVLSFALGHFYLDYVGDQTAQAYSTRGLTRDLWAISLSIRLLTMTALECPCLSSNGTSCSLKIAHGNFMTDGCQQF